MDNHHEHHQPAVPGSDIDRRLSKLEAVVESLAGNIGRITDDIGKLAGILQQRSQTNWGTIFAGITLVVLLVTGYVGLPLNALSERFAEHRASQDARDKQTWQHHGRLDERIRQLEGDREAYKERVTAIEREVFAGAQYRAGRPIRSTPAATN